MTQTTRTLLASLPLCLAVACGPLELDRGAPAARALGRPDVVLRCAATNDYGYVGSAEGSLAISGSRRRTGEVPVEGTLRVGAWAYGDPPRIFPSVEVAGVLGGAGPSSFVSLDILDGTPGLVRIEGLFDPGAYHSNIYSDAGTIYVTDCRASTVRPLAGADLVPEGQLDFQVTGGTAVVRLHVVNLGTQPARGSGHVRFAGRTAAATLHQHPGGSAREEGTLNPGERGYLRFSLSRSRVAECRSYDVTIDSSRSMQAGEPDPFGNDRARVAAPCPLRWTTPVDEQRLGGEPDARLAGKTLADVVSSRVSARDLGELCSNCHYQGSGRSYGPPVGRNGALDITPDRDIGGRAWRRGWAEAFVSRAGFKPDYLRAAFAKWLADGALD